MINTVRIIAVLAGLSLLGAGFYAAETGLWGESGDLDRSTRVGSGGGGYGLGRIK